MAGFTEPGALLEKLRLPAGQAAIVDELVANGAARPAAAEERDIPVQPLVADMARPGLDSQQHRFPLAAEGANAHGGSIPKAAKK